MSGDAKAVAKVERLIMAWNGVKERECSDGNSLSAAKLNKLATAGKNLMIFFAEGADMKVSWDSSSRVLRIRDERFDFS